MRHQNRTAGRRSSPTHTRTSDTNVVEMPSTVAIGAAIRHRSRRRRDHREYGRILSALRRQADGGSTSSGLALAMLQRLDLQEGRS